jgi:serine/threonine-protein kinase
MELVEGETLETRVRRDGPMPLALALEVIEQAARALAAAEARGVVHRDIKPSNIMLECDAAGALVVKLIDYGLAKLLAPEAERPAEQTQTGFLGTPAFASPEQFPNIGQTRIDTRSDIYSLGVTFWYLLCGRVPFVGRTLEDIHARQAEPVPVEQLKGLHVPSRCRALLKSDAGPRSEGSPAICARITVGGRPLLRTIQRRSTCASESSRTSGGRYGVSRRRDCIGSLVTSKRASFCGDGVVDRGFAFRKS